MPFSLFLGLIVFILVTASAYPLKYKGCNFCFQSLITENVESYFYKCYICNIGFKRRGMLVNHLTLFHPAVSLDTVPELNVPIQKAYCDYYCQYCDKVRYCSENSVQGGLIEFERSYDTMCQIIQTVKCWGFTFLDLSAYLVWVEKLVCTSDYSYLTANEESWHF